MAEVLGKIRCDSRIELSDERLINRELHRVVKLGELAISLERLGINDPLTPLCDYLESGELAIPGIKENLETSIAERLPYTPFVNHVEFDFTGQDFVSKKDKISMAEMTSRNLRIINKSALCDDIACKERERAEAEANEAIILVDWFKATQTNTFMIFESLPIGDQTTAISRIYHKKDDGTLEGSFISLYNPSLDQFNIFRKSLKSNLEDCNDEISILRANYDYYDPNITSSREFVRHYVGSYDQLMNESDNRPHYFGLTSDQHDGISNGLDKVRMQPGLTSIYMDMIRALASSKGKVTSDLANMSHKLEIAVDLREGHRITITEARQMLSEVITSIVSVIDQSGDEFLRDLKSVNDETNYATVAQFGKQARSGGIQYSSLGCPEYLPTSISQSSSVEQSVLSKAFGIRGDLDNFGQAHIGVCRVPNCPSRGKISWLPERTLVGGCNICTCCHKLFGHGKNPAKVYTLEAKRQRAERTY